MTDYKCPNCGGGFPANAAVDGECPWCARGMKGGSDSSPTTQTTPQREVLRISHIPSEPDSGFSPTPHGIYPQIDVPDPATHIPHLRIGGGASGELLTRPTANPDASAGERVETLAERADLSNNTIGERDAETQPRRVAEKLSNDITKDGVR